MTMAKTATANCSDKKSITGILVMARFMIVKDQPHITVMPIRATIASGVEDFQVLSMSAII
jgi:hypothetical protein